MAAAVKVYVNTAGNALIVDDGVSPINVIRLESFFYEKDENKNTVTIRDTDDEYSKRVKVGDLGDQTGTPYGDIADVINFFDSVYDLAKAPISTVETATTSDITGLTGTTSATLKSITFVNIAGTLVIDGESFPEGTYSFNNPNGTLNGISYDATGSTNCKILTQK